MLLAVLIIVTLWCGPACDQLGHAAAATTAAAAAPEGTASKLPTSMQTAAPLSHLVPRDGAWVRVEDDEFETTVRPWLDRYAKCNNYFRYFRNCSQPRTERVHRWRWESPDSLAALHTTPTEVYRQCLAGKKIVVLGDSLSVQSYESLVCLLGAEQGLRVETVDLGLRPPPFPKTLAHPTDGKPSETHRIYDDKDDGLAPLTTVFYRTNYLLDDKDYTDPKKKAHPKSKKTSKLLDMDTLHAAVRNVLEAREWPDYLVINTGAWYLAGTRLFDAATKEEYKDRVVLFDAATRFLVRQLEATFGVQAAGRRRVPQIVYRTDTIGHFPMPSFRPPTTDDPAAGKTCTFLQPDHEFSPEKYGRAHKELLFNQTVWKHFGSSALLDHVWVLDAGRISLARRDAHHNEEIGDCLHFCLPGPPDAWSDAFLAQVWRACTV